MADKTVTGARVQVMIDNPATNSSSVIGIFDRASYSSSLGIQEVNLMGRYTAAETVYTHADLVDIRMSGYRVVDHGAHADGAFPKIGDLMNFPNLTCVFLDRPTGKKLATIRDVKPKTYSQEVSSRNLCTLSLDYVGIMVDDEDDSNPSAEGTDATTLPV